MKILVTGNSGYIGNHLVNLLKFANHEVYGQDIVDPIIQPNVFYKSNILRDTLTDTNFDCVIHLAALVRVGESEQRPIDYYRTNVEGTIRLLEKVSTKNFIFASTGMAAKCASVYGISKKIAEDCVKNYCVNNNIQHTIFRFFNVIGNTVAPATNPDGLFYKLNEAVKTGEFAIYGDDYPTPDGTALRDYIHVEEVCHAIIQAVSQPSNDIEHLGHGFANSVKGIVELFKQVNNVDFRVVVKARRPGDIDKSVLDNPSTYMPKLYSLAEMVRIK